MNIIKLPLEQLVGPRIPHGVPKITPSIGWIAGGAVRQWFSGQEKLSDIDVFFINDEAFNTYEKMLVDADFKLISQHKNAKTYRRHELIVQCITISSYSNVTELFDSFDFSVCQFAWNGEEVFATSEAIISVLRGHLGVHKISKTYAVDSLRRAFKYAKKGFYPCSGTIEKIALALRELSEEDVRRAIEISPGGGQRVRRID